MQMTPWPFAFSASRAEAYVDCIARAGGDHRLCFDRRKLEPTMPILCVLNVLKRDGHPVECKSSLVYLGCLLENAADIGPELNRRLGSARADFQAPPTESQAFNRVWKHACVILQLKPDVCARSLKSRTLISAACGNLGQTIFQNFDAEATAAHWQDCCAPFSTTRTQLAFSGRPLRVDNTRASRRGPRAQGFAAAPKPRLGSRPVRGQARWWSPYASTSAPQPCRPSAPQRRAVRGKGSRRRRLMATCIRSGARADAASAFSCSRHAPKQRRILRGRSAPPGRRGRTPGSSVGSQNVCSQFRDAWQGQCFCGALRSGFATVGGDAERCTGVPRLPPYSRWPPRPQCRQAGGSRACRGAPTQSRTPPGVDPRRASTTRGPRCRSRGPLERRVPAVPPYLTPAPCPTRPTTLARLCSPGLGAPLVECAPAAHRRQLRVWSLDHAAAAWCARRAPVG